MKLRDLLKKLEKLSNHPSLSLNSEVVFGHVEYDDAGQPSSLTSMEIDFVGEDSKEILLSNADEEAVLELIEGEDETEEIVGDLPLSPSLTDEDDEDDEPDSRQQEL